MKKLICLLLTSICLMGCSESKKQLKVQDFTYAYQTSEFQDYTHDIYVAHCVGDIYVEVPEDYYKNYVNLSHTGKMIYYYVYGVEHKVSNKGWERV